MGSREKSQAQEPTPAPAPIQVAERILAPAAGMHYLEDDIKVNDTIYLMLGVREVEGKNGYQGIGFRVSAKANLISNGPEFEMMKEKYPFLRAVLELTPVEVEQLL